MNPSCPVSHQSDCTCIGQGKKSCGLRVQLTLVGIGSQTNLIVLSVIFKGQVVFEFSCLFWHFSTPIHRS